MRLTPPSSLSSPSPSPRTLRSSGYATGDTGSTESKGAATRSLHRSILGRQSESQVGEKIKREEKEGWSDSSDEEGDRKGVERQGGIDRALASLSSEEEGEREEGEGGSSWDYVSQAHELGERGVEERERERREVKRERSEFDGWLTASLAPSQVGSVDGREAYDSLVDATRIVQVGLSRSRLAEHESLMGSLLSDGSECGRGRRVDSFVRSQESSMFLFPSIVFEDLNESKIEVAQKVVKVETAVVLPIPSQRRWKVLSGILGASLLLSLVRPYISVVVSFAIRHLRRPPPSVLPYLILVNSTSSHPTPLDLGTPLSLLSLTLTFLLVTSIPISLHLYSLLPSSSPSPPPSPSPLLTMDPTSILQSRQLLHEGIYAYQLGHLVHSSTLFSKIIGTNCEPSIKASASEWLGRTLYRLSKVLNDREKMESAVEAFGRSIRIEGKRGSAWASRGRAKFHLGDWEGAAKDLRAGIKKDGRLGWAYEYLGKTMVMSGQGKVAEGYLQSALELDPTSYSTYAFYGEYLHAMGRNEEAKAALESAIALRSDYPAAHNRLSFLYTELLDITSACLHLRRVLACRSTGYMDACLPTTTESMQGSAPYLRLYFLTPPTSSTSRIETLKTAHAQYPNEILIEILLAINNSLSPRISTRKSSLLTLLRLSTHLNSRSTRYPTDLEAQGLSALVLCAMGKVEESEKSYAKFWEGVKGKKGEGEVAWVVMACFEARKGGRK